MGSMLTHGAAAPDCLLAGALRAALPGPGPTTPEREGVGVAVSRELVKKP